MKDNSGKYNVRYLGFESVHDGSRRFDFSITAPGSSPLRASFEMNSAAFVGINRVTFQESAALCYEKLRHLIDRDYDFRAGLTFQVSEGDIQEFRPKSRRASAKTKS